MSLIKCCFDAETEILDTVVQHCTGPGCCCGCCQALRPRYKRLVDNIFPVLPQDGLVKNSMDRLTYYAVSSPEKLDRIGEYLYQKAGRDIYRRRYKLVAIAMEAMDQLLASSCHSQTLNLYVESFLKMVQKLLESTEPELQIMATQSFVHFANIEEDLPNYHNRYDFFVSKFSSMCHNNHDDLEIRDALRLAGIKGLQGVLRKTVSDDLVANIWESVHMDKIVPSLLYNMQNGPYLSEEDDASRCNDETDTPPSLAESCLRELVGRASFGHIRSVLRPLLRHLDNHHLWVPNLFAIHTFKLIMHSIQAQFSYAVVEALMFHLDEKTDAKVKTSIADVLYKIIAVAAGESVGPSVLEIINSLLNHLRVSVSKPGRVRLPDADEQAYQESLINALGEFANHLPDYQKIEIMMFIMAKVPYPTRQADYDSSEILLENILLKSLLKVSTKYRTIHFSTTFPPSFLEPLLRMSLAPDPAMRILVQNILHTLIDRHSNLQLLKKPTISVKNLELKLDKSTRPDMIFIRKYGPEIFTALYESLELPNNSSENIENIYTTIALLTVELLSEETIMDLARLLLSIQDMTLTSTSLSSTQKSHLHAIIIAVLSLVAKVMNIEPLFHYVAGIVERRKSESPHLLPPLATGDLPPTSPTPPALIDLNSITDCLQEAGIDVQRLLQAPGYVGLTHRHSWVDSSLHSSAGELNAEVDSITSSPGLQKRHIEEALTFESMKKILAETAEGRKAIEDERRLRITQIYKTATFQELVQRSMQRDEDILQNKLNDILSRMGHKEALSPVEVRKAPVYETLFPELFIY